MNFCILYVHLPVREAQKLEGNKIKSGEKFVCIWILNFKNCWYQRLRWIDIYIYIYIHVYICACILGECKECALILNRLFTAVDGCLLF